MISNYRYQYQPKKKYLCPNCGHKTLKRFIDTNTNQLISEDYGVCERMFNCGYEKRPATEKVEREPIHQEPKIPFYFDPLVMGKTLNKDANNVLFKFLCSKFDKYLVYDTFCKYQIGTSDWGDTIFWQVNQSGRIVAGKKIQYFSDGHRNKARGASWLHNSNGFDLVRHELTQTLFGAHLINSSTSKIFVVESEKTAILCDIVKKDENTLFVACGGMQNLGLIAKIKTNAEIICIPDTDSNQIWADKIKKLNLNTKIEIIPCLQKMPIGSDIGDYILFNC
jgi:predicted RNA-binding Zn-ribbon protein involved in translation (DUF1610 family)